ncbi:hypothetical protein AB0469_31690 [Streptomyces sp. NPDC093801]|uniref:hypothetical protein n=1 Tax=unclassified Streptomyces TaxID=2593676 RepID=UPI003450FCE0
MSGRRPRRTPTALPASGVLDWSDKSHWARTQAPCRYCQRPTFLRDDDGRPADKVCAEDALQQQAARVAAAYRNDAIQP